MKRILNLGCGTTPFPSNKDEIENLDILLLEDKPNIKYKQHDLLKLPYPYPSADFDEIWLFHVIEHIPEGQHYLILTELRRLIKNEGRILITYPEFLKCAHNYVIDKDGRRDYWKACIYGRGWTAEDCHKALMDTTYFTKSLNNQGLDVIKVTTETKEPWNTLIVCKKGDQSLSYEELMSKEFNG